MWRRINVSTAPASEFDDANKAKAKHTSYAKVSGKGESNSNSKAIKGKKIITSIVCIV